MRWMLGIAITLIASNAYAECFKTLPSERERTGHWHYRYVKGEKCWEGPGYHRRDISAAPQSTKDVLRAGEVASRVKTPTPIEGLPVEEEPEAGASPSAPTRVKIIPITNPPSVSRRIQRFFEELATRCQDDIRACAVLTGD